MSEATPPAAPRSPAGTATRRRKRQVRWGRRLRRFGLAWQNALEIARAGRLTAPYGHPFALVHEDRVYKLRRYDHAPGGGVDAGVAPVAAPLLLVPPLMVASEVYDIAPDVSAVALLKRQGVDVWMVDFGAPEREEGGMDRTLDDHVRAVSDAIDRVHAATGRDVHLCGYSQGGMFCYQAAAFRRSRGLASVITYGSPVDLHRTLPRFSDRVTERIASGLRTALAWPLEQIEGLPGVFTSTGFKLLSARKEAQALVDFVRKLHDRQALEKREAKRLFLAGEGFVAWPGPAFRKFFEDMIVANRMSAGGFVIDGQTVSLADIDVPVLYFVGDRDEMGRPAAVRGIRRAAPAVDVMYEVPLRAGHFGLVVGSTAQTVSWPTAVAWMRWREGTGPVPALANDVRALPIEPVPSVAEAEADADEDLDDLDPEEVDSAFGELSFDVALAQDVVGKTARALWERLADWSDDLGGYVDNLRWQLPRLTRLRDLTDDTLISPGRTLADQAAAIPERTFFLWRGRAFTFAEANRRVDAIVRGLVAVGLRPGQRVGVLMHSRPSHLSLVTALSRLGAVAVLLSPATPDDQLGRCLELGEVEVLIADPEGCPRARAAFAGKLLAIGGVGEPSLIAPGPRVIPPGVIDLEDIDPTAVPLPSWYRANPGRARDLAMLFVSSGVHEPPRAVRITNRRWAFSALGAAAAATLTGSDTVYNCLPLHHPAGTLVATGSALVAGTRLALASSFDPTTFWTEVRRYGATVVFYAGEMCRSLVDAPSTVGEQNNPVRLFAGSGLRADTWRRLVDRFGPVAVLELYASTEASAVLANAAGRKIGAVGRPLPGSAELALAAWDFGAGDFVRDAGGRLVRARLDEPGMLVARLDAGGGARRAKPGADIAHIDPRRLLADAFAPGDTWFVTGDFLRVDEDGDYWFVGRRGDMFPTPAGPIAATRVEDALYQAAAVRQCVAFAETGDAGAQVAAAVVLSDSGPAALTALADAIAALPPSARPHRLYVVDDVPMTDGYRPLRQATAERAAEVAQQVLRWDDAALTLRAAAASA